MGESFWLGKPPGEVKAGPMQELMMQRAQGTGGPSAAELMMQRGMGQQVAAGRSAAASMPGVSPGLAMRQAGLREASAMSNVGQQMGILRAQEQAAAMQAAQQAELEMAMYNAARQQRQGMLGPILSTAGQVGGALIGGPWGAAAGQQVGQGIGNYMGGGSPWGGGPTGSGFDPYGGMGQGGGMYI
jgi:hypothetical protein